MEDVLGIKMDVNNAVIGEMVRQTMVAQVAAAMENKEAIIHDIVESVMLKKVRASDGKTDFYRSDETCSFLEFWTRKALAETVKQQLQDMVEEMKPDIAAAVKKELSKAKTTNVLVQAFVDSLTRNISSDYRTTIDVNFAKIKD